MASSNSLRHPLPLLVAAVAICTAPARLSAGEMDRLDAPGAALISAPLTVPLRTLKVATLDLPRPLGAMPEGPPVARAALESEAPTAAPIVVAALPPASPAAADRAFQYPPPLVLGGPSLAAAAAPAASAPLHPYLEVALDALLELPVIQDEAEPVTAGDFGPDFDGQEAAALTLPDAPEQVPEEAPDELPPDNALAGVSATEVAHPPVIGHDSLTVFGSDPKLFPPLAFQYHALADQGFVPAPLQPPAEAPALTTAGNAEQSPERDGIWPSPAQRLGLEGPPLARAQKCLAEAIYFESRGEPKRGQIAVAQVVVNRVFSGYYPADVCGTVYQNAHRHLACQFTFACDNVKDVIREPDMWVQAKEIAADMLDGKLWLDSVGRATHYHAYWVHPRWVREMRKLDRIGVHTFYRPRRWQG
ncbi:MULTISPECIES: cell wall hydrolase [unclassified Xanthobacter]|uniref:cell wall hydrolase n=1 Tax=unclassified Xanthobacter TaxID=2623496 RepID=UPI001EE02028|nr:MULTISPECIES: cell wall hydrolase [unclassified Xanthobacter]